MIDIHSHILPEMDDGAKNVEESVKLLRESFSQGVTHIAATSHFYAEDNSPREFVKRRERAYERLKPHLDENMPEIFLGAEVKYFEGISRSDDTELLKIEGTNLILVEMPFMDWNPRIVSEVCELQCQRDTQVVLAHIERYFRFGAKEYIPEMIRCGMFIQSNAESFVERSFARRGLLKMLSRGDIHVLGSDCHNMKSRPPLLLQARKEITEKIGKEVLDKVDALMYNVLSRNIENR